MRRPQIATWQVTLAVFLVLVGFLVVLQVRAGRTIRREVQLPTLRVRDLAVLVRQQEEALGSLQAEVEDLRAKLGEYESAAAQGRSSAETLAREVGAQTLVLNPIEGLTKDEQAAGKGYVELMEDNLKNLRTALGCT